MTLWIALAMMQAAAQQAPAPPERPAATIIAEPVALMIAAFDRDGDARVTRSEFDQGAKLSFEQGEASRTSMSMIDLSHWATRWLGNQGAVPGQFDFDRDGDNAITSAEYAAEFARQFARLDTNKDAVLDRSELVTIMMPRGQGREGREPRMRRNPGGQPPGAGRYAMRSSSVPCMSAAVRRAAMLASASVLATSCSTASVVRSTFGRATMPSPFAAEEAGS